jgi:hypothetical protein
VNDYSLHPTAHNLVHEIDPNIVAHAAVLPHPKNESTLEMERILTTGKYAFEVFYDLDLAVSWIQSKIDT